MGYKVNFLDDTPVTAADLNNAGYNLKSAVYTTFSDGVPYGVDDLNSITKGLISAGVRRGLGAECLVVKSNGKITIRQGVAFFHSGASITIDSSGITLEEPVGTGKKYVYLYINAGGNIGGARIAEKIAESDVVILATIESGTVSDARQWAYMLNPSELPNQYGQQKSWQLYSNEVKSIHLGGDFRYLVASTQAASVASPSCIIFDLWENTIAVNGRVSTRTDSTGLANVAINPYSGNVWILLKYDRKTQTLTGECYKNSSISVASETIDLRWM